MEPDEAPLAKNENNLRIVLTTETRWNRMVASK
jgi:hypothetical protein